MTLKWNPLYSKFDLVGAPGGGTAVVSVVTDAGTATPNGAGALTVVGGEAIDVTASGSTVTVASEDATETNKGVLETATNAEAIAAVATDKAIVPANLGPLFASPPAIGSTTPAGGAFTTLSASGAFSLTGDDVQVSEGGTGVSNIPANALIYGNGTAPVSTVGPLTDGQFLIGLTGGAPFATQIAPGTGISILNAPGSVTINSVGGGFTWNTVSGTAANIAANNGYKTTNGALTTLTLPPTMALHSMFTILGLGTGLFTIAQRAGQQIRVGNSTTTVGVGGSVTATAVGDAITILCTAANTSFAVVLGGPQGNFVLV